jgi:xanthine dehydrogenase accessory factor
MDFWSQVLFKLRKGNNIYLLTVVENYGSSPGRKGFKMFVSEDGDIQGSIGGGVMEYNLVEEAKEMLKKNKKIIFSKRQIHRGKSEFGSGMSCSGEQTVAFHPLGKENIPEVQYFFDCSNNNTKAIIKLTSNTISFELGEMKSRFKYEKYKTGNWLYKEQLGCKETIYIVGGGHVGLSVSQLFSTLGFHIVVFDNRNNLNTLVNNRFAHDKHVIDYRKICDFITQGENSFIVIMTNKSDEDRLVLSNLLRNNYKFIGVLGSKAKIKTMFKLLKAQDGFTKDELNVIKAPIGIPISSQTPEEIAVSIAAQIIKIKNNSI